LLPLLLALYTGCKIVPKTNSAFYITIGSEPVTLNPLTSQDVPAREIHGHVLEGLLTQDIDTYEWKPSLAESWEINKEGTEFTFKLREGVRWHDGKPLTPEDVKFSFDAIFDEKYNTAHKRPY